MAHIGVALSGGGHRATLFGLGAMAYLLDAGKGPRTVDYLVDLRRLASPTAGWAWRPT